MYWYIGTVNLEKHLQLAPTQAVVLKLVQSLPYTTYQFTLFCDNLFSNPTLFSLLWNLGIRACGTARLHITKPVFGNLDEWKPAWGTLRCAIIPKPESSTDKPVLVFVWLDSNKVGFCTTIHDGTEWVARNRKRPKATSTFATITKQPFYMLNLPTGCKDPYKYTRILPIPGAIDDYNHYMGGVDIVD